MTHNTDTPSQKKPRRWLRLLLIGSLTLNLLVAGALVGAFLSHEKPTGRHMDRLSMGLGAYVRALPEAQNKQVSALMSAGSTDRKAFRREMRARQKELETLLLSDDFSAQTVRDALSDHRGFALRRTSALHEAYVDAVVTLSAEERVEYVARVKEILSKRRGKKRRKSQD